MRQTTIVTVALILASSLAIGQVVLFEDDFNVGMDDAWLTPNGGWVVEEGRLVNTTTCGFQQCMPDIWAGGAEQQDYLISFDLSVESVSSPNGMSLHVRAMMSEPCEPLDCPSSTDGYSCDVGYHVGGAETAVGNIHRLDSSVATYLTTIENEAQFYWQPGVVYHVVFGRIGDEIVFKKWAVGDLEPDWLLRTTDTTYHAGYWSISFWHGIAWIDNFLVTGYGVVPNEDMAWGGVKALYR